MMYANHSDLLSRGNRESGKFTALRLVWRLGHYQAHHTSRSDGLEVSLKRPEMLLVS
jgi:hypothetical protein